MVSPKIDLSPICNARIVGFDDASMAWLLLVTAGLLECGWAIGIRYSDGFTKPIPTAITILTLLLSMWLLSISVRSIPIGTAYAVWTGIGAVGVAILGILFFGDSRETIRLVFLSCIVIGIVGLYMVSSS
jgi:quaternary ammonium compound-resistance protein SugE